MYGDDCALRAVIPLHKVFAVCGKDFFRQTAKNVAGGKTVPRRAGGCMKNTLLQEEDFSGVHRRGERWALTAIL